MGIWMSQYAAWLTGSDLGKIHGIPSKVCPPYNHTSRRLTQFLATTAPSVSQVTVAKMLVGDNDGAASVLQHYFGVQFHDQIAKSGEQPFEAIRTRPYH
jgi:hypothetical protein